MKNPVTGNFYYGNTWYVLPFKAMGYYVTDATGRKNVCEATNENAAKALVETLNKLAGV
jgi:hypothetical protein